MENEESSPKANRGRHSKASHSRSRGERDQKRFKYSTLFPFVCLLSTYMFLTLSDATVTVTTTRHHIKKVKSFLFAENKEENVLEADYYRNHNLTDLIPTVEEHDETDFELATSSITKNLHPSPEELEHTLGDRFTGEQYKKLPRLMKKLYLGSKFNYSHDASDDEHAKHNKTQAHVVTTFFIQDYTWQRVAEILAVLNLNLDNPYISALHILWQDDDPSPLLRHHNNFDKLIAVETGKQPTYKEFMEYINGNITHGSLAIICNADIYFGETLRFVHSKPQGFITTGKHKALALSRWDSAACHPSKNPNMCDHYIGSHDAFFLSVPIEDSVVQGVDHHQNRLGAENMVIYMLSKANYQVLNACFHIKIFHLHCSKKRNVKRKWLTNHTTQAHRNPIRNMKLAGPYFGIF